MVETQSVEHLMEYVAKFLKAKLWEVDDLSAALLAYCAMAPIALTGRDEE